ncbi:uncharacterized protein GGS22DRAFT_160664 [Annulohypoxylon maeteangense]|uniref:uncharacterized protein n=1 Tax=Annulohypoxylon maeteangense TaxID=1927788 RepID=UPI002007BF73|nr:uncharacterized protein GGS22DRAFT_160664 [Annulohypoxylon maeteangense]KAI0886363.1 hypothetical protein GGS22DRAFT_160664 [Annulohypoxylon maeteangense]
MSINFTTLIIVAAEENPDIVKRQVVITQTITYPDSTSTTLVTLDRGSPPTSSSTPSWSAGATSSDGLGQTQIGIIVGCLIGALVLGIVIWCCCTKRCGCSRYTAYEDDQENVIYYTDEMVDVTRPADAHFRRPIPRPPSQTYVATAEDPTVPRWTAYEATRRFRPNYYSG